MSRRGHNERGAVTIWLVLASLVMVSIIGITVDLGGQLHAKQRAHTLATQAARAGAEQITAAAMTGADPEVDPSKARAASRAYLRSAGVDGSVTIGAGGTQVTVQVTDHYTPLFLGSLGIGPLTVTGTSTAQLARAVEGTEQ